MLCCICVATAPSPSFAEQSAMIVSAAGLAGGEPCSDAIQSLIDAHPNREIFFPDGTYLLDKPICTPADPKRSVALRLSAYAHFKAVPSWTNTEAMVRLGGKFPANDIATPGSWYWMSGGIVDGSGRADGISIDGGRETAIRDVSIKATRVGFRVKYGANNGSSDCDVRNVNIYGNGAADSVGVIVDGFDNTFANMRIANVVTGVLVLRGAQCFRDIHPLFIGDRRHYAKSVGFDIRANNVWCDFCYSDQFATGFRLAKGKGGGVYDKCYCFWYSSKPGMKHVAFASEGKFEAQVNSLTCRFRRDDGDNALLTVGEPGGTGYLRDTRVYERQITSTNDVSAAYSVRSRPVAAR